MSSMKLLNALKRAKLSPGLDNLPMSIIKKTFGFTCESLLHIINLSLTSGIFPAKLKNAKLIPIFKVFLDQF